jgi:phage terminase large subunit-like protein
VSETALKPAASTFRGYSSRRVQPAGRQPWPKVPRRGGPKPREVVAWLRDWLPSDLFRVLAWYQEVIEELYGTRRPTQAVVSIGRGNGKSTFAAGLGVFELMGRGELQPQVLNVATSFGQARIVFDQAVAMIEASPELRSRALSRWYGAYTRIEVPQLGGAMQALPTRDARSLQGYTPSLAVVDEIGFINAASWAAMAQAIVKRRQAQVLGIGTPGLGESGLMWRLRALAREDPHPGLLYREYAVPDGTPIDDERAWRAANPGIRSGVKSIAAMRDLLHSSSEEDFRTYQLGQWTQAASQWLPPGSWDALPVCEAPPAGAEVVLGFDGSANNDSTALCWASADMVGLVELWEHPGDPSWQVPRDAVKARIRECFKRWRVRVLAADPFGWQDGLEELAREFGDRRVTQYPTNSYGRFAPACDRFYTAVKTETLRHDHAPALARHIANAIPRPGPKGTAIGKAYARAKDKIDAAVAAVVAHDVARSMRVGEPREAMYL